MILQFSTEINPQSQRIAEEFFKQVQKQYPEVSLLRMYASPEYDEDVWMDVQTPMDEDRETELQQFATTLALDILLHHGFQVMMYTKNSTFNTSLNTW
jgi:hypothetical protein